MCADVCNVCGCGCVRMCACVCGCVHVFADVCVSQAHNKTHNSCSCISCDSPHSLPGGFFCLFVSFCSDGVFFAEMGRTTVGFEDSGFGRAAVETLAEVIHEGFESRALQRNPHIVLLDESWYHENMKPALAEVCVLGREGGRVSECVSLTVPFPTNVYVCVCVCVCLSLLTPLPPCSLSPHFFLTQLSHLFLLVLFFFLAVVHFVA